jgi:hypothetical protein
MRSGRFAALVSIYLLVSLFLPTRSEAQPEPISRSALSAVRIGRPATTGSLAASGARATRASERDRVLSLGMKSGTFLGAVDGAAMVRHVCADNDPDFGVLCPLGVVTLFAGTGAVGGSLTGIVIAPTVHGSKWKNILKGMAVGTLMGGVMAKTADAHGKQIAWALLGNAAQGVGTAAIIVSRVK